VQTPRAPQTTEKEGARGWGGGGVECCFFFLCVLQYIKVNANSCVENFVTDSVTQLILNPFRGPKLLTSITSNCEEMIICWLNVFAAQAK